MHKQLVHSKSDQNYFENKNIIDDISKNMKRIKQAKRKKVIKKESPFNSNLSTPTSSSSIIHNSETPKNVHIFFSYLVQILKVKGKFERDYFNRYVLPAKISNSILITYIKEYAKIQFARFEVNHQLINDFNQIITIINSVTPDYLFREIRSKILVEFETVQLKIKNVHEKCKSNFSETQMSFFNSISHTIFFLLSTITYRVDYYAFGMNRLIEKLNKFFDRFLDEFCPDITLEGYSSSSSNGNNNNNEYNICLRFIQKYTQIKLKFIDEFYKESGRYTKFNSLGRFVFNNLNEFFILLDGLPFKTNDKQQGNPLLVAHWIHFKPELHYLDDSSFKLSTYFSMFFNSRLAKWKNDFFHPMLILGEDKEEICRICEQRIKLHHYYLHIYYCLNYVISFQQLKKSRKLIQNHLNKIEQLTDYGNNNDRSVEEKSSKKILGLLIQIEYENNCSFDSYENESNQCFYLLSLINEIMINCINYNSNSSTKDDMNGNNTHNKCVPFTTRRVLQLVSLLLKKFRIVVDILTLKEMRTKNKMSYCDNYFSRLFHVIQKNIYQSASNCSYKQVTFNNFSFDNTKKNKDFSKSANNFTCQKIKQTLNELKSITKDELSSKPVSKSKFCQSYGNSSQNEDITQQETTIEIYPDANQDPNDSLGLAFIPKISDFILICPIAKGGYGRVDLYKKASTGDIFAIKTIYFDSMQYSSSQVELLKNETLISNEIDNEYLVKCYYIICENSYFYFVAEYMPGRDLLQLLNSIILSYKTIQLIVAEILLGIEYLHSKEIVHKDIKPENVVISRDGHFKLTDFGISEIYSHRSNKKYIIGNNEGINDLFAEVTDDYYDENDRDNDNDTEGYSNTKKDKQGTLHYMAPECFNDDHFTPAVDFWALGVVLFELFSLKLPFFGSSILDIKKNILMSDINWSLFDNEDVTSNYTPNELNNAKDLINKLLVKDPLLRYSDNDISKIRSHQFFTGFNWKEIKAMKDYQVLLHVKKMIEKTNQQIKEANKAKSKIQKHNNQTFPQVFGSSEKKTFADQAHHFYYSERVDNIFKKCQETMHKIIDSNKYNELDNQKENISLNAHFSGNNNNTTTTSSSDSRRMSSSTLGNSPFSHLDN